MPATSVRRRKNSPKTTKRAASASKSPLNDQPRFNWRLVLLASITGVLAALIYGYLTSPIEAVDIVIDNVALDGEYAVNEKLASGKKISNLPGAECIEELPEKNLVTGLIDGRIVQIKQSATGHIGEGDIELIRNIVFPDAPKTTDDMSHGRPLGFKIRKGVIYVLDATYGFYTLNIANNEVQFLVTPDSASPPMRMPNDVDVTADGTLAYFTDTSSRFPITQVAYSLIEGQCVGRLFKYEFASKRLEVLLSDLCFANGVQLSKDERTLVVAETNYLRLRFYDTQTWELKKSVSLPFMPDNIRLSAQGGFLVAGANVLSPAAKIIYRMPKLRQALAGLLAPDPLMEVLLNFIRNDYGIVVEMEENGSVLQTWQDPNGELTVALSHAIELSDGKMALGSFFGTFMAVAQV